MLNPCEELADLESKINIARDCGCVQLIEIYSSNLINQIGWLFSQFPMHGINQSIKLHKIDEGEAKEQFVYLMTHDMAHSIDLMPMKMAEFFWGKILDRITGPAEFLTNTKGMHNFNWAGEYDPATSATFDSCLIIQNSRKAVIVVIEDED
ncbi:hypothetical protein [Chromobacterium piscinae]|uniref:hypothetical protein n=1 Tax=Chromobacterium piscinae TaxID=686831 RepID=UPI001C8C8127|nr:hypothetical protein [Chromobacterium vaccinii]